MPKLNIELKNCYGIKEMNTYINFNESNIHLIYAPNWCMKSSLAEVFYNYSDKWSKDKIIDRVYKDNVITNHKIDLDGQDLIPENILVIKPHDLSFKSDNLSNLLVEDTLNQKYSKISQSVQQARELFLKWICKDSWLKEDVLELRLRKSFWKSNLKDILEEIESNIDGNVDERLLDFKYWDIFNDDIKTFTSSFDIKTKIESYTKKLKELYKNSRFFDEDGFRETHFKNTWDSLEKNLFFHSWKHWVIFEDKEWTPTNTIKTNKEFKKLLQEELSKILKSERELKEFQEIQKAIKNPKLRKFQEIIEKYPFILGNLDWKRLINFSKSLFINYINKNKDSFESYLDEIKKSEKDIKDIVEKAKEQGTIWKEVLDIFQERFRPNFTLNIKNKHESVLWLSTPVIWFSYEWNDIEENELVHILSYGERRTMYILNILFELRTRKDSVEKQMVIFDDIADSFDYKNKYAIVEYIKDLQSDNHFNILILTHNFDFFRTLKKRLSLYNHSYITLKNNDTIRLLPIKGENIIDPIANWKKNLSDAYKLISAIPMVRQLVEIKEWKNCNHYKLLTCILHIKENPHISNDLKIWDIKSVFQNTLDFSTFYPDESLPLVDFIDTKAKEIPGSVDYLKLEHKITLAINIRLNAEKYIIYKLWNNPNVTGNQTWELFKLYKDTFSTSNNLKSLHRVILMTPESIHLNSFMYEPLLDMWDEELKNLHSKIIALNSPTH